MTKIDRNIPIPLPIGSRNFPVCEMEVGDSFFVQIKSSNSARVALLRTFGKGNYTTAKVTENGVEGIRCWRTK